LFFVGSYLPDVIWFNLEEEIVAGGRPSASLWFFVVLALQPSFHRGGCFTRIGLFMEFLCILHRQKGQIISRQIAKSAFN
jgi:hypothetical protein